MDVTPTPVPRWAWREGCGYQRKFKYDIELDSTGINQNAIMWANHNCKYKWGWWFTENGKLARMSFENRDEAILWALRWQAEHRDKDYGRQ